MALLFLSAMAVGFSGAMMPGSLLTYTIRRSLADGPRAGFIITAGHAVLELVLIILIFLGFDMVLQSDVAQITIGFIGGILLMAMGVQMIVTAVKDKIKVETNDAASKKSNAFFSGIVISASNPYFLLWWAAIGLGFIMQSYNSYGYLGVAIYYFGHISADFIWYGAISTVVGKTRKFIKQQPYRVIIAVLGSVLIFFGGQFIYGAILKFL